MIDERLSSLMDKLLEVSLEFLKENGYDNVDYIHFVADGLEEGMKHGKDCPSIDNVIVIRDKNNKKLGEYM